jgi:hypothetical protein
MAQTARKTSESVARNTASTAEMTHRHGVARASESRLVEFLRLYRTLPSERREEAFRFWAEHTAEPAK